MTSGIASVIACALLIASPAHASLDGSNGKIAFLASQGGSRDIYAVNADGTGLTQLTTDPALSIDSSPAWSPDGTKIAFSSGRDLDPSCLNGPEDQVCNYEIYVMNADGSSQTRITNTPGIEEIQPAWTPDGARITATTPLGCNGGGCYSTLRTFDASSGASVPGPHPDCSEQPAWSPDGTLLAYNYSSGGCFGGSGIFTVKADGTQTQSYTSGVAPDWDPNQGAMVFYSGGVRRAPFPLAPGSSTLTDGSGRDPVWSPDTSKIAYVYPTCENSTCTDNIWAMASDGVNKVQLTHMPTGTSIYDPSWQPLPSIGYARPKGATPFQTYLTVAFRPCDVSRSNRFHGPPWVVPACNPPAQASDYVTVGTLDANGEPAKSVGSVRLDVKNGNPSTPADEADVKLNVSIKDVRNKSDLTDYTGELRMTSSRRITDKDNTPNRWGEPSATLPDLVLAATVPCATTDDTTIGSLCSISTTADALIPGQVKEGMRSIWQFGQVQVFDGGADADADTTADNTLFMDEGVFVP